ncbi:hypothetical protein PAL_GLEAN10010039 [Pteropus alecto]|uniref:Uncharacterized protein n=1 Tax=Pteropus alecto TaxID=9402 RepID=L5KD99_PTEAL|nr:hypothetical protein PAL_GLEAN10010039 [Pteropus alecto]
MSNYVYRKDGEGAQSEVLELKQNCEILSMRYEKSEAEVEALAPAAAAPLQVPMSPSRRRQVPSKDSFSRFEVFRGPLGGRLCRPSRKAAVEKGADPGCAAPRGLRHCCSPSPRLVWPLPSPPLSPPPFLRSALPCRAATVDTLR